MVAGLSLLVGCSLVDPLRFDTNPADARIMPYDVKEPTIKFNQGTVEDLEEQEISQQ